MLAFTGGIGNAAQAASKVRYADKLRGLGGVFRRLLKALKRKKLRKKVKVNVDTKKSVKAEVPEGKKLEAVTVKKLKEKPVKCFKKNSKGTPAEYDRQLKGQQDGLNNMTAKEYLAGRKAYTGDRASTASTRAKYEDDLIEKYVTQGKPETEAIKLAESKLKFLDAKNFMSLHVQHLENYTFEETKAFQILL